MPYVDPARRREHEAAYNQRPHVADLEAVNGDGDGEDWFLDVSQTRAKLATAACCWRSTLAEAASPSPDPQLIDADVVLERLRRFTPSTGFGSGEMFEDGVGDWVLFSDVREQLTASPVPLKEKA